MNLRGITKNTELEENIKKLAQGEAMAGGMYFSLSFIAKEQGLDELSEVLARIAKDEVRHSGLYSYLNGAVQGDLENLLPMFQKEELNAAPQIAELAKLAGNLGMPEVEKLIADAANDEKTHGALLTEAIAKLK